MPSLSSYTPLESLLFFQSLAGLDSRPSTFVPISDLLKNNAFVQQHASFDKNRLSPQALEELYGDLVKEELDSVGKKSPGQGQNGHSSESPGSIPKKRKISQEPLVRSPHSTVIPALVSRLYSRYKELVTSEIEEEEKKYKEIRDEIQKLEIAESKQPTSSSAEAPVKAGTTEKASQPALPQSEIIGHQEDQHKPNGEYDTSGQVPAVQPVATTAQSLREPKGISPEPLISATSTSSAQLPAAGANQPAAPQSAPGFPIAQNVANGSAAIPPSQQPSPAKHPISPLKPATIQKGPATGPAGPIPAPKAADLKSQRQQPPGGLQIIQQYPFHTTVSQQPQNFARPVATKSNPQTPLPHVSPYANAPYASAGAPPSSLSREHISPYAQRDPSKSFQSPYAPPQTGYFPPASSITEAPPMGSVTPAVGTPASSASLSRRPPRPSLDTSGSLTPWKLPAPTATAQSPGSPLRPRPEDISPISERAPSPGAEIERHEKLRASMIDSVAESGPAAGIRSRRSTPASRGRGAGSPISPVTRSGRKRGPSITSRDDESVTDSASVTHRKIKDEIPSTPGAIADETEGELRSSARLRGHEADLHDESLLRSRTKRKRGDRDSFADGQRPHTPQAGYYVQYTRNFPRTSAPIMNDVAAHKHASIFAKPLTERDAPGYKDLIYRPQDIKSIKSAIHQGTRAVATATESADSDAATTGLGLKKTPDLVPPKAIINSSQLETELIRMFANAIMFNPTPETTFGSQFKMKRYSETGELVSSEESTSRASTEGSEPAEGGIIDDTLEMYNDVEQAVSGWRAAERTVDESKAGAGASRGRSVSDDVDMESADELA